MGKRQILIEEMAHPEKHVDFACFHRGWFVLAVVMFVLGFATATGLFYAHFGPVIKAAQKAGAVVQKVEALREAVNGIEQDAAIRDLAAPLKSVHCVESAGDKLTAMQLKYRKATVLERMKMRTELDKATDAAIKESGK
jgi:hypothetical protein